MRRLCLAAAVWVALASFLAASGHAGIVESNLASQLRSLAESDRMSAIVYLQEQANIAALDADLRANAAPMAVRHARVIEALRAAAARTQPALLAYLDARKAAGGVEGYTAYWIMNLVVVSATRGELEAIARRPDVASVGLNFRPALIEPASEPVLRGPIAGIGTTPSLRAINADRVWNELGITGAGRLIGGLDTGVSGTHPALASRWRGNFHPAAECWRDALGGGTTFPTDSNGHGTHTMGTMCGAGHATGDTVGVAFDAQWIADNSINQGVGSAFDNDVLGAFQWFTDPDGNPGTLDDVPDVVQNSWGIDARFGGGYQDCDARWQTAIVNCEAAGVVVTFSAGNEGPSAMTHRSPANICTSPTTNFSVGAVDGESFSFPYPIASFSSRGPSDCDGVTIKPEVSAPGVNVYSSYPGGGYARLSGTSMAGPHVAGVVALMREANPNADVTTIKNVLMNTARDEGVAGEDNTYGRGVIDAYAAVLAVMQPSAPVANFSASPTSGPAPLGVQFTDLSSQSPTSWLWNFGDGSPASPAQHPFHAYGAVGSYTVTLTATNAQGSDSETKVNYITVNPVVAQNIHVRSIAVTRTRQGQQWWRGQATVTIEDETGAPVSGAAVSGFFSAPDGQTKSGTTGATGVVVLQSNRTRTPPADWCFEVANVVKAGETYNPSENLVTRSCESGPVFRGPAGGESAGPRLAGARVGAGDASPGTVAFTLEEPAHVRLEVFDVAGRRVATLADRALERGHHRFAWDGGASAEGVYFYRLETDGAVETGKFLVIRP